MKTIRLIPLWKTALAAISITGFLLWVLVTVLQYIQHRADMRDAPAMQSTTMYSYPDDYELPVSHYYTYLIDTTGKATINDAIEHKRSRQFAIWPSDKTTFNLGMSCVDVWLHVPVHNQSSKDICLIWQLENAIDSARLYIETGNSVHAHSAVSFYAPLARRALPVKALFDTIWLSPGAEAGLYFHVFKNHYNTNIPMTLLPLDTFLQHENRTNNIYTAYISIFIFIILFNVFLFISLRDPIHLWYSLFIFSISMMLLIDAYYPVLIFPDLLYRITAVTEPLPYVDWGMVGSGLVMQLLLGQDRTNSYFWLPFRILLGLGFATGALQLIVSMWSLGGGISYPFYYFHTISNLFVLVSVFMGMCSVVEKVIQRSPIALVYFCTSMLPILGILNSYLNCIGFTNFSFMFPSSVAIGIMAEIIVLTMLLTQRYNVLQKEKNQLLQQQLAMQKELGDRIAETQENEQKRIAEDLHDGIGSMLTALRMMINKGIHHFTAKGLPEAAEILLPIQQQLDKVVVDIRTISHNLMPKDFEQSEFDSIIRDHLSVINAVSEVNVEYYLDPLINQLPKGLQISLFRIFTELLNNSLKHSQTQHITAQFIIHPHILMLMIEDEGIGFAMDKANDGIGLKNIRSRVRFLSGKISFDSSPKGTIIIVEIPLT